MSTQMILASRLTDGRVVFMTDANGWSESIDEGLVVESPERAEALLEEAGRAVESCVVVDPYLIDITVEGSQRRPTLLREAIRAFGPSPAAGTVVEEY